MPLFIKILMYLENFDPVTSVAELEDGRPDLQVRRIAVSDWRLRRKVLREHLTIWSALEQRDVEAYTNALRTHIESCDKACKEGLQKMEDGKYY